MAVVCDGGVLGWGYVKGLCLPGAAAAVQDDDDCVVIVSVCPIVAL